MKLKKFAAVALATVMGVSALTGCGLNKNDTIATLGEVEVKAGTVNFATKLLQYFSDDFYTMYYNEDYWTSDASNGEGTNFDTLKKTALESVHAYYTLQAHMDEYKVTLSSEDEKMIKDKAKEFVEANKEEVLKEMTADLETVEEYFRLALTYQRMYEEIIKGADTEVSDEEANMRAYSMVAIDTTGYYNSSYQYIQYSEEESKNQSEKALYIATETKAGKKLEDVAKEKEVEVSNGTYAADNTTLPEDVKKALDELEVGKCSEQIKVNGKIYIVRLDSEKDEEATENNRKSIIQKRETEFFQSKLEEMQKDDGWTVDEKVLGKIKFSCHFTAVNPNASKDSETESETQTETESQTESQTETQK